MDSGGIEVTDVRERQMKFNYIFHLDSTIICKENIVWTRKE